MATFFITTWARKLCPFGRDQEGLLKKITDKTKWRVFLKMDVKLHWTLLMLNRKLAYSQHVAGNREKG
jgi:hypothetical protein